MSQRPHVVVIGGGFGGLAAIQALRGARVRITLIDKRNHHLFQPLLYQVATAGLAPSDIAEPLRGILAHQANVEVRLGEVARIDTEQRRVISEGGVLHYDTLVVAAGATPSWFGRTEWAAHAPGLKTIGDALTLRHRLLQAFEAAEWTADPQHRERLLTFVVVGAGATGVELAGAIREIAVETMVTQYRHLSSDDVRVVLVEAADACLPPFPDSLQQAAKRQLEELGVEVRLATRVTDLGEACVMLDDEVLHASTIVWAAGVRAVDLGGTLGAELDRAGRVVVQPDLSIPGHPEVFVIGDLAHVQQADGSLVPGVAQGAIQMGKHVARTIRDELRGRPRRPFAYTDLGTLATIGHSRAVADFGRIRLTGWLAWVVWVFVHLMTLVGHRSRAVVFVKWAWAWTVRDRSSRLLWQDEARRDAKTPPR